VANEPESELDRQVTTMSKQFSQHVRGLASNPSLRDALLRACLNDLAWELYFEFPESRYALQAELEELGASVKLGIAEEGSQAQRIS
jgi:hypothetical protein